MTGTRLILVWAILALTASTCVADWKPAGDNIRTRFAQDVRPDSAWREYPRPQMLRQGWQNLNGLWRYQVRAKGGDYAEMNKTLGKGGDGDILVPYCIESSLSGVGRLLEPEEELWYQREFKAKKKGDRLILHFEAVDYECVVWVNGKEVGAHTGGNNPFSFDITDAAQDGANRVSVRVWDATGGYQLSGKQVMKPRGIFYTRVSGIWQTVWLESVPRTYIKGLKIDTAHDPAQITVKTIVGGDATQADGVRVTVSLNGKKVAAKRGGLDGTRLAIKNAKLWSPAQPALYDLKIELLKGRKRCDTVTSYAGIRSVGRQKDAAGHWRFTLNGEAIFHLGPLDQGWYPEGLLTPASDAAMLFDIQYIKDSGFNMIRNHIKVRPRRYYYHCDRLGLMVWQDQVSTRYKKPKWTRMKENPKDGEWDDEAHAQFMAEYKEMIDGLYNAPCIVMWIPFNEAWGQHHTMDIGKWTVAYDPSRLVNVASGGNYWPVGHVADHHSYPHPDFPLDDPRFDDYVKVVGEFGGHGFVVDKTHLWNPDARNWGYGGLPKTQDELMARYVESYRRMKDLKQRGIAGAVYTQTSDIEGEVNGLLTYDRAVEKFPREKLKAIHTELYAVPVPPLTKPEAAQGKRKCLFILAGQSNMQGMNQTLTFEPRVCDAFGAENVLIVKEAIGGRPIRMWVHDWAPARDWMLDLDIPGTKPPSKEENGVMYRSMMQKIARATDGVKPKAIAFCWMQGERDARERHSAVYERSLKRLFRQLQEDFPGIPVVFVIGKLSDFGKDNKQRFYPEWEEVCQAQENVARDTPNCTIFSTDDLNTGASPPHGKTKKVTQRVDDLHMSAQGYRILGTRFAESSIRLLQQAGE
jgi:hypothetical protein